MAAPMPPSAFVHGLNARGLALRIEGDDLYLMGPKEARNDKIRAYLRSQKPALLDFLRSRDGVREQSPSATASAPSAGQQQAKSDAELAALGAEVEADLRARWVDVGPLVEGNVIRFDLKTLYCAAKAGRVPEAGFRQDRRGGFGTSNARAYVLSAVGRLRAKRSIVEAKGVDAFTDATRPEWYGLAAVWEWWSELGIERQQQSHERIAAAESPVEIPAMT